MNHNAGGAGHGLGRTLRTTSVRVTIRSFPSGDCFMTTVEERIEVPAVLGSLKRVANAYYPISYKGERKISQAIEAGFSDVQSATELDGNLKLPESSHRREVID